MKSCSLSILASTGCLAASLCLCLAEQAELSKLPASGSRNATFAELPAAVQNTIRGQAGSAPIEEIDVVTRNGQTTYNAAFKRDGKNVELVVDSQGNVLRGALPAAASQTRVPLAATSKTTFEQVPAAVQNTLRAYSKGAAIEDIDKGTVQGKTIYEAAFKHRGENVELRVAEDGSLVNDHENAKFLGQFGRPAATNPVGRATSWQVLSASGSSSEGQLANATRVEFNQVPVEVQKTLRTQAGTAPIEGLHRGSLDGKTVYQATVSRDGRKVLTRVAEDGSLLR